MLPPPDRGAVAGSGLDGFGLTPEVRAALLRMLTPLLDENSRLLDRIHAQEEEIARLQERLRQHAAR